MHEIEKVCALAQYRTLGLVSIKLLNFRVLVLLWDVEFSMGSETICKLKRL